MGDVIKDVCATCSTSLDVRHESGVPEVHEPKAMLEALCASVISSRDRAKEASEYESGRISSLQEQLWESEAQRAELQNTLDESLGKAQLRIGDAAQDCVDHKSNEVLVL